MKQEGHRPYVGGDYKRPSRATEKNTLVTIKKFYDCVNFSHATQAYVSLTTRYYNEVHNELKDFKVAFIMRKDMQGLCGIREGSVVMKPSPYGCHSPDVTTGYRYTLRFSMSYAGGAKISLTCCSITIM